MLELISVGLLGLATGMAIGLFAVFPIYFAGFVVYAIHTLWSPELLLVFWSTAAIGSQFFGSVSTITLGIPGEASALVYIDRIKGMSLDERNQLLYHTAKGSLFAGLIALFVVWLVFHLIADYSYMLGSVNFTLAMFAVVITLFAVTDRRPLIAILLLMLGTFIGPVNNFALPAWWYQIQLMFESASFFMLVASLMLVPDLVMDQIKLTHIAQEHFTPADRTQQRSWWTIIKSTVIGLFAGLVPGPAAETASALAYHAHKKQGTFQQIVAAETANNPGVVMMLLPFFTMGVPITSSALIISTVMDIKNVDVIEFILEPSRYLPLPIVDVVLCVAGIATLFYFFLSTHFIDFYVKIVKYLYSKGPYLLFLIVGTMVFVDMSVSETPVWLYSTLLIFFTALGFMLKYLHVNPILFIFGVMFGDKLIWTIMQFTTIHF